MQMLKTLGAIVGSSIANAMLVSFIYACRDDDEDEGYWKKYFQSFGDGALDAIIPLNYFPVLRDVVSIIQGYDIERSDMSIISDVVIAYNKCVKDGMTWQECGTFLTTTLALFGIPLKNVWREVLAGVNTVHTVSFKNKDKITQLELSLPQKYQDYYDKYWEEGYNEEECKSKANSQIKSTISKELKGAYLVAYNDKDYDTVRDIRSYMYKSGYYESVKEIDDKIEDWRKGQEEEEERAETARNR